MEKKTKFDVNKFNKEVDWEYIKDHGSVEKVSDGIVFCSGLEGVRVNEIIMINNEIKAIVLDLSEGLIGAGLFDLESDVKEGMEVEATGELFSISLGDELVGRVINSLGAPIDGKDSVSSMQAKREVFSSQRPIMDICDVYRPLMTGMLLVDALFPIGKGQRQLILGNRQTGKTQIGIETILNQKGKNVECIYVSIGQKISYVADVIKNLTKHGAMEYTTAIVANASSSLTMQYLAPYAGIALAESMRDQDKDVLVVFDDLTKHADIYRTISLLFQRPPGREAYPGDIFYSHSSLLERASQLKPEKGGGSISAFPIVELLSDDLTSYIPTNIISITDGQLYLKSDLFNANQRPAISTGESVSRVGSNAQHQIMKKYSAGLMFIISQYFELLEFLTFDNSLSQDNLKIVKKGEILVRLFSQNIHTQYSLIQQICLLYCFKEEMFMDIDNDKIIALKNTILFELNQVEGIDKMNKELENVEELSGELKELFLNTFRSAQGIY